MPQAILIGQPDSPLLKELALELNATLLSPRQLPAEKATCIYYPSPADRDGMTPDLAEAHEVFQAARNTTHFILLSSALIYGAGPGRPPFVDETYTPPGNTTDGIRAPWQALETAASDELCNNTVLTILRPSLITASSCFIARRLSRNLVPTLPGHDPVLQLLSVSDLAQAIHCAITQPKPGTFNVAPANAVPLHQAIRLARNHRLPLPRTLQRLSRKVEALDYLRYSWTISNHKIKEQLGFVSAVNGSSSFDLFGMDENYIRFYGKTLFRFLRDFYWRIEDQGLEHIPSTGPGLLVGMHRGFMPFDGVMALDTLVKKTGRYPRFLTHPALLKFPFLANFMTKLGGVVACQESAGHVLRSGQLLGIFPEGIQGTFTSYRNAYQLQAFGRDSFVKLALRHRAPIIPFVTVGSAEIFPILGKIKSRRWTRYSGWPFIPITPTFPLIPVPLPSKWHTQFLAPISVEQYPPQAADDRAVVKAISREVRARMQQAVDYILARRRSIFFGSIFNERHDESQSKPVPV